MEAVALNDQQTVCNFSMAVTSLKSAPWRPLLLHTRPQSSPWRIPGHSEAARPRRRRCRRCQQSHSLPSLQDVAQACTIADVMVPPP